MPIPPEGFTSDYANASFGNMLRQRGNMGGVRGGGAADQAKAMTQMARGMRQSTKATESFNTALEQSSKATKKSNEAMVDLKESIKRARKEISLTSDQMEIMTKKGLRFNKSGRLYYGKGAENAGKFAKAFELYGTGLEKFTKSVKETTKQTGTLASQTGQAAGEAGKAAGSWSKLRGALASMGLAKVKTDVDQVTQSTANLDKTTAGLGERFKNFTGRLFQSVLTLRVLTGAGLAAAASIAAIHEQDSINKLKQMTDQFDTLTTQVDEFGRSLSAINVDRLEAFRIETAKSAMALGVEVSELRQKIVETGKMYAVQEMSNKGLQELVKTQIMMEKVTGVSAEELGHMMGILTKIGNIKWEDTTDAVREIGSALSDFSRSTGVTKEMSQTLQKQISQLSLALNPKNPNDYKDAMVNMTKEIASTAKAFSKQGFGSVFIAFNEDLTKAAEGNMDAIQRMVTRSMGKIGFEDIMDSLESGTGMKKLFAKQAEGIQDYYKTLDGLREPQKIGLIMEQFGLSAEQARKMIRLNVQEAMNDAERYEKNFAKLEKTFEELMSTWTEQWNKISAATKMFMMTIGSPIIEFLQIPLKMVASTLEYLVGAFVALPKPVRVLTSALAVLGTTLMLVGFNPMVLGIVAIISAIGVLTLTFKDLYGWVTEKFPGVGTTFKNIGDVFRGVFENIKSVARGTVEWVVSFFGGDLVDKVAGDLERAKKFWAAPFEGLKQWWGTLKTSIMSSNIWEPLVKTWNAAITAITGSSIYKKVSEIWSSISNYIKTNFGGTVAAIEQMWASAVSLFYKSVDFIKGMGSAIGDLASDLKKVFTGIQGDPGKVLDGMYSAVMKFGSKISETFRGYLTSISQTAQGVGGAIYSFFSGLATGVVAFFERLIPSLKDFGLLERLTWMGRMIRSFFEIMLADLTGVWRRFKESPLEAVKEVASAIGTFLQRAFNIIVEGFSKKSLATGITGGIIAAGAEITSAIISPFRKAVDWVKEKSGIVGASPSAVGLGIVSGITSIAGRLFSALMSPFKLLAGAVSGPIGSVLKILTSAFSRIATPLASLIMYPFSLSMRLLGGILPGMIGSTVSTAGAAGMKMAAPGLMTSILSPFKMAFSLLTGALFPAAMLLLGVIGYKYLKKTEWGRGIADSIDKGLEVARGLLVSFWEGLKKLPVIGPALTKISDYLWKSFELPLSRVKLLFGFLSDYLVAVFTKSEKEADGALQGIKVAINMLAGFNVFTEKSWGQRLSQAFSDALAWAAKQFLAIVVKGFLLIPALVYKGLQAVISYLPKLLWNMLKGLISGLASILKDIPILGTIVSIIEAVASAFTYVGEKIAEFTKTSAVLGFVWDNIAKFIAAGVTALIAWKSIKWLKERGSLTGKEEWEPKGGIVKGLMSKIPGIGGFFKGEPMAVRVVEISPRAAAEMGLGRGGRGGGPERRGMFADEREWLERKKAEGGRVGRAITRGEEIYASGREQVVRRGGELYSTGAARAREGVTRAGELYATGREMGVGGVIDRTKQFFGYGPQTPADAARRRQDLINAQGVEYGGRYQPSPRTTPPVDTRSEFRQLVDRGVGAVRERAGAAATGVQDLYNRGALEFARRTISTDTAAGRQQRIEAEGVAYGGRYAPARPAPVVEPGVISRTADQVGEVGSRLLRGVQSVSGRVQAAVQEPFADALRNIAVWLGRSPSEVGLRILQGIKAVGPMITQSLKQSFDAASGSVESVKGKVSDIKAGAKSQAKAVSTAATDMARTVNDKMTSFATSSTQAVKDTFDPNRQGWAKRALSAVSRGMTTVGGGVMGAMGLPGMGGFPDAPMMTTVGAPGSPGAPGGGRVRRFMGKYGGIAASAGLMGGTFLLPRWLDKKKEEENKYNEMFGLQPQQESLFSGGNMALMGLEMLPMFMGTGLFGGGAVPTPGGIAEGVTGAAPGVRGPGMWERAKGKVGGWFGRGATASVPDLTTAAGRQAYINAQNMQYSTGAAAPGGARPGLLSRLRGGGRIGGILSGVGAAASMLPFLGGGREATGTDQALAAAQVAQAGAGTAQAGGGLLSKIGGWFGRGTAAAGEAASGTLGKVGGFLGRVGGKVAAPIAGLVEGVMGYKEAKDEGRDTAGALQRGALKGGGALAGGLAGAKLGALLGSVVPGLGNVVGGVVGAIGGSLIGAFGGGKLDKWIQDNKTWQRIKTGAGEMWDWIKDKAGKSWAWISDAASKSWDWITKTAGDAWDWIVDIGSSVWDTVVSIWTDTIGSFWAGLKEGFWDTWKPISEAWAGLKQAFSDLWVAISDLFGGSNAAMEFQQTGAAVQGVAKESISIFKILGDAIKWWLGTFKELFSYAAPVIKTLAKIIGTVLGAAIWIIVKALTFVVNLVRKVVAAYDRWIEMVGEVWKIVFDFWDGVKKWASDWMSWLASGVKKIWGWLTWPFVKARETISGIWGDKGDIASFLFGDIKDVASNVVGFLFEPYQKAWDKIKELWNAGDLFSFRGLRDVVGAFFGVWVDRFKSLRDVIAKFGAFIWEKISYPFKVVWDWFVKVKNYVYDLFSPLTSAVEAISDKIMEYVNKIIELYNKVKGIKDSLPWPMGSGKAQQKQIDPSAFTGKSLDEVRNTLMFDYKYAGADIDKMIRDIRRQFGEGISDSDIAVKLAEQLQKGAIDSGAVANSPSPMALNIAKGIQDADKPISEALSNALQPNGTSVATLSGPLTAMEQQFGKYIDTARKAFRVVMVADLSKLDIESALQNLERGGATDENIDRSVEAISQAAGYYNGRWDVTPELSKQISRHNEMLGNNAVDLYRQQTQNTLEGIKAGTAMTTGGVTLDEAIKTAGPMSSFTEAVLKDPTLIERGAQGQKEAFINKFGADEGLRRYANRGMTTMSDQDVTSKAFFSLTPEQAKEYTRWAQAGATGAVPEAMARAVEAAKMQADAQNAVVAENRAVMASASPTMATAVASGVVPAPAMTSVAGRDLGTTTLGAAQAAPATQDAGFNRREFGETRVGEAGPKTVRVENQEEVIKTLKLIYKALGIKFDTDRDPVNQFNQVDSTMDEYRKSVLQDNRDFSIQGGR
jgi:hypothetical protein